MRTKEKMKYLIILLLLPQLSWADDGHCYKIKDFNNRYFCLAIAKGEQSYCHKIDRNSLQYQCLAELTGQKAYCDQIKMADEAANCRRLFRYK